MPLTFIWLLLDDAAAGHDIAAHFSPRAPSRVSALCSMPFICLTMITPMPPDFSAYITSPLRLRHSRLLGEHAAALLRLAFAGYCPVADSLASITRAPRCVGAGRRCKKPAGFRD